MTDSAAEAIPLQRDPREELLQVERDAHYSLLTVGAKMAEQYLATPRGKRTYPEDTPEYQEAAQQLASARKNVERAFSYAEDNLSDDTI